MAKMSGRLPKIAPPDCAITSDSIGGSKVKCALPIPSSRPATGSTDTGSISDLPVFCSKAKPEFSRVMTVYPAVPARALRRRSRS